MGSGTFYNSVSGVNIRTIEKVDYSLGKGMNAGLVVGKMFNKNIGVEIGVSYLFGGHLELSHNEYDTITKLIYNSRLDYTSRMLKFDPSIIIATDNEKTNLYVKFGLIFGLGSIIIEENDWTKNNTMSYITKYNGGMAFGTNASIGLLHKLSRYTSFYTEISIANVSYAPTKGEVTSFILNGVDRLGSLSMYDKQIKFVDTFSYNPNAKPMYYEPQTALKQKYPFGSICFSIGIRHNFYW